MNKNSYVTAALFAVFVLLTVVYWNMPPGEAPQGLVGEMFVTDIQSGGDLLEGGDGVELEVEADVETEEEVNADIETEEEVNADVETEEEVNAPVQPQAETVSSLQRLRSEQARQRSQQVASLHEIIASADHDANTKSMAKDQINSITTMTNNQHSLETIIRSKGFQDVLVRADEDAVRVTIQVSDLESAPSREQLAELYVLAGIEFVNQGNISITFEPLN